MSEAKVFDLDGFLKRIGGDSEIAEAVVDGFLLDIPERFEKLQNALSKCDAPLVRQHAHAIHGASVNIGANFLAEKIRSVEDLAKAGDLESVSGLILGLEKNLAELEQQIRQWRLK